MIYTLQTFQIRSESRDAFVKLSEEAVWPALEQQGARALGLWQRIAGGTDRLLQMTRYDSLARWQEIQHGNENDILKEGLAERNKFVNDSDQIVLRPLTRRQPEGDAPESEPGIYAMRRFDVERGKIRRLVELSEDGWWPWVIKGQGLRPLGQWLSIVAPETRVYMIARYDDLAHWEATRGPGPEPSDPEMHALWDRGRNELRERTEMTRKTDVCILRPISRRRP
jgi:hypothetical protein